MRHGRAALVHDLLPVFCIDLVEEADGTVRQLNLAQMFGDEVKEIWLEVGFGSGENLVACAKHNPQVGIIGCDPFFEGVGKLISQIDTEKLENIRIYPGDARALLRALPPSCLSKLFALFPDPWPKRRHHKRRLFQTSFLDSVAGSLQDDGEVVFSTDHAEYARWVLGLFLESPYFAWEVRSADDWLQHPIGVVSTRYELKALREGRRSLFLRFRRKGFALSSGGKSCLG
ncbi:MAG: tRNA (guanosine(46)-N7)-methyltransferase TrmB [Rhodospirillaceae bacterium]|nr:tRNA (guanosine(46)-N7)-methyltransferase TrmB [Rhodospirillaceae bacterium]|tara:strand:- start:10081 stop:10770 length:690 start_codon:yes stop_codon:yes gene_type:complete